MNRKHDSLETNVSQQPQLQRLLRQAVSEKGMAHAYLLSGPDSSGLVRAALTVACSGKCKEKRAVPCGLCSECTRVIEGNHPDIHLVCPDGDTLKLEQVLRLQSVLHMKSNEAGDKVGIMADAENMSLPAANSLLKILEDPPAKTTIILTARNAGRLPPTVLSRCQEVRLSPLPPEAMAERLVAGGVEAPQAQLAARLCQGDEERARRWLDGQDLLDLTCQIAGDITSLHEEDPLMLAQRWENRGKDKDDLSLQLEIGLLLFRDALVSKAQEDSASQMAVAHDLSLDLDVQGLSDCIRMVLRTQDYIRSRVNARLALDAMFMALRGVIRYAGSCRDSF